MEGTQYTTSKGYNPKSKYQRIYWLADCAYILGAYTVKYQQNIYESLFFCFRPHYRPLNESTDLRDHPLIRSLLALYHSIGHLQKTYFLVLGLCESILFNAAFILANKFYKKHILYDHL